MRRSGSSIPPSVAWVLALAVALLPACDPPTLAQAGPERFRTAAFAFLQDGRTTREEVLLRLGTPSARFQEARILSYTYVSPEPGWFIRVGRNWGPSSPRPAFHARAVHDLVLAFDEAGVLRRHALVVSE